MHSLNIRRRVTRMSEMPIDSIENFENKYLNIIESQFMFVLTWVLGSFIEENLKNEAHHIIIEEIKNYRRILEFKFQNPFGKNFFSLLENNNGVTVFDVIYDIRWEKWIYLKEINFLFGNQINSKFDNSYLDHNEIIRLNPEGIKIESIQKQIKNEQDYLIVLNNYSIYVDTPNTKLCKFFLEFLIEYEKNFIVFGENYTGKSYLLQDLYKCKLERNQMSALFLHSTSKMKINQVKFMKLIYIYIS